jgi:tight adherence protein B
VTVAARVAGIDGLATSTYRVPGDASFVLIEKSFWTSTLGIVLTTAIFALLLMIAFAVMLARHWKGPGVRDRIGGFVSMPGEGVVRQELVEMGRAGPGAAERSLERTQWWQAFKEKVEIARIETAPIKLALWTAIGSLIVLWLMSRHVSPVFGVLVALIPPLAMRAWVQLKLDRQRKQFAEQLPDILQGSASAIRAGHGLTGALSMVVDDAPEPSRTEFRRVVTDEQLGVPLDEALRVVSERMDSRDVQQIALVAQIQRDTGGNTAEVLDRVTEALRRRAELRRMISALTAQGRLSRWVVTLLPLVLLLIIAVLNPSYIDPLFNTTLGNVMLAVGAVLMISGSLVIKKIVDFKV